MKNKKAWMGNPSGGGLSFCPKSQCFVGGARWADGSCIKQMEKSPQTGRARVYLSTKPVGVKKTAVAQRGGKVRAASGRAEHNTKIRHRKKKLTEK